MFSLFSIEQDGDFVVSPAERFVNCALYFALKGCFHGALVRLKHLGSLPQLFQLTQPLGAMASGPVQHNLILAISSAKPRFVANLAFMRPSQQCCGVAIVKATSFFCCPTA